MIDYNTLYNNICARLEDELDSKVIESITDLYVLIKKECENKHNSAIILDEMFGKFIIHCYKIGAITAIGAMAEQSNENYDCKELLNQALEDMRVDTYNFRHIVNRPR